MSETTDKSKFWKALGDTAVAEMLAFFPDTDPDMQATERVFALLKAKAPRSAFDPDDVAAWKRTLERFSQPPKKPSLLRRIFPKLEER
jgi:hypothetical protein